MKTLFIRHEDDPPLVSTPATLEKDVETALWTDIQRFLESRIEDHRTALETLENAERMLFHQAIIANCRDLLSLPGMFMDELKAETEVFGNG